MRGSRIISARFPGSVILGNHGGTAITVHGDFTGRRFPEKVGSRVKYHLLFIFLLATTMHRRIPGVLVVWSVLCFGYVLHSSSSPVPMAPQVAETNLCGRAWRCDATCPLRTKISVRASKDYVAAAGGDWESDLVKVALFVLYRQLEVNPAAAFLDVGANLGVFSFHAAARAFPVLAFEPMPANRYYLNATLGRSALLRRHVTVQPIGLGNSEAACDIWAHRDNVGNGQIACDGRKPCPECVRISPVRLSTLDSMRRELPEFIGMGKVDIEGLEPLFFKGGEKTLRDGVVPVLFLELSSAVLSARSGVSTDEFLAHIVQLGFSIYHLDQHSHAYFSQTTPPAAKNSPAEWRSLQSSQHELLLIHRTSRVQAEHIFGPTLQAYLHGTAC